MIAHRELAGENSRGSGKSALEYVWLCSPCSLYFTIQIDEESGARVVQKLDVKNMSSFGASLSEGNKLDIA